MTTSIRGNRAQSPYNSGYYAHNSCLPYGEESQTRMDMAFPIRRVAGSRDHALEGEENKVFNRRPDRIGEITDFLGK